MSLNQIKPFIYFIPLAVIQVVLVPFIGIDHIVPDLITILLVYSTLKNGQIYGTVAGFIFGFAFDLISGGILGSAMFSKTLTGFITGYFYNENKVDSSTSTFIFVLILFMAAFIDSFFYSAVSTSTANTSILFLFVEQGILPGFYTAIVGTPIVLIKPKEMIR